MCVEYELMEHIKEHGVRSLPYYHTSIVMEIKLLVHVESLFALLYCIHCDSVCCYAFLSMFEIILESNGMY